MVMRILENKVQELLINGQILKLLIKILTYMLGKLQTNKVKFAVEIFDFIHSLDSSKKISDEQKRKIK